jgi:hypothetical protein
MSILATSQVRLEPSHQRSAHNVEGPSSDCFPIINALLQNNHDNINIFFRPVGGHNHTAHAILTIFAMGGVAEDLKRAFEDNDHQQKPIPPVDSDIVEAMKDMEVFTKYMRDPSHYNNYLRFFEGAIEVQGWKEVLHQYLFASTPVAQSMFVQLFEGLYHPLIHIGFGIEFEQPAIIAEGLAQAASHVWGNIGSYLIRCDEIAGQGDNGVTTPLQKLYGQIRANDKIRTSVQVQQGPNRIRDGLMPNAMEELASIAAKFRVGDDHSNWEPFLVESTSCAAYNAAAAQRKHKAVKIDFFSMHAVTSSLFLSLLVRQSWIPDEQKVKLIEWKGRLDLAWYASCGSPELNIDPVKSYKPTKSRAMNWQNLYDASIKCHDDGHITKFLRALRSAEKEARDLEQRMGEDAVISLPIRDDLWVRVGQMCLDSTMDVPLEEKWLMGAGFDPVWKKIADAP